MAGEFEQMFAGGMRAYVAERERALALEAIISYVAVSDRDRAMDEALEKFGAPLTQTEKTLLGSLTRDECKSLREIRAKLGGLATSLDSICIPL